MTHIQLTKIFRCLLFKLYGLKFPCPTLRPDAIHFTIESMPRLLNKGTP